MPRRVPVTPAFLGVAWASMASTTGVVPAIPSGAGQDDEVLPVPAAPPELAALEAERTEKRELLDRAAEIAVDRTSKGALPAGCTPADVPALLQRYYFGEPAAEVLGHDPAELAGLALGHLKLAEVRPQGAATVDVQRLEDVDGGGGAGRPAAIVRTGPDAMPFLVDSVTAEVVRQGIGLQHVVHPVVVVRRDVAGRIRAFCDAGSPEGGGTDALPESWMAVVVDGPIDDEAAEDLVAGLRTVLADVRAVDEDAGRMRARALELADRLERAAPAGPAADPAQDPAEAAALLRWLADGNFVFLGARDVEFTAGRDRTTARAVPGTGLGVLRHDTDMSQAVVAGPGTDTRLPPVTKAAPRSPVPRRAWLDLVAVAGPGAGGDARQH